MSDLMKIWIETEAGPYSDDPTFITNVYSYERGLEELKNPKWIDLDTHMANWNGVSKPVDEIHWHCNLPGAGWLSMELQKVQE